MKIYTTNNTETNSVEILLDYQELKKLVSSLKKFEDEVNQFKMKNKDAKLPAGKTVKSNFLEQA